MDTFYAVHIIVFNLPEQIIKLLAPECELDKMMIRWQEHLQKLVFRKILVLFYLGYLSRLLSKLVLPKSITK